jgi:hypothetical protein
MERREVHTVFWWGNLREGRPGVDGKIILKWIFEKWIDVAQDRHRWRDFVSGVMNLCVPQNEGNFLTS